MGMGIELFSIREWEWELIPIFWQRMGMGIELQFNSFSLDKNGDTLEKIAQKMSDLSSQPCLNKYIKDVYFNLSSGSEESQNFE